MIDFKKTLIFISFFLCGATGLIYEVAVLRILETIFGTSVLALSTVLASFMAGLALGSLYFGRFVDNHRHPLRIYAYLLLLMSFACLLITPLFRHTDVLCVAIHRNLSSPIILSIIRFLLSFLLLLIPTSLFGGTFPVISKYFCAEKEEIGSTIGRLYGINTLGGVLGCFVAGFFLIGSVGIKNTVIVASLLNLLVGILVLIFGGQRVEAGGHRLEACAIEAGGQRLTASAIILWAIGISGFAALSYEVIWTRVLKVFLANTTYAFSCMLGIFLVGLGIGSFIIAKIGRRINFAFFFGVVQVIIGIYALFALPLFYRLPSILFSTGALQIAYPALRIFLPSILLSSIIMFIPTVFMGMTIPLAVRIYTDRVERVGTGTGRVYSANTLGTVLGIFVSSFLLIPCLGIIKSNLTVALINILLGGGVILAVVRGKRRGFYGTGLICLVIIVIFVILLPVKMPLTLPPSIFARRDSLNILYHKESASSTITVVKDRTTGERICYTDNSAVIGTGYDALKTTRMLGHLPVLLHRNPQDVLVIGFGIGVTTASIAKHRGINSIECVEISPMIAREASKYFIDLNGDILCDPRVTLIEGDGRNHLLLTDKKYDIISCDPTHPIFGSGNLYTREYFELCKKRLLPGGMVCQYLPLHKLSEDGFRGIIKTFHTVFPHTTLWLTGSHCILLGCLEPLRIDFAILKDKMDQPDISEDLKKSNLSDPCLFLRCLVLAESKIEEITKGSRVITDFLPYVEFFGVSNFLPRVWENNLLVILKNRDFPSSILFNINEDERAVLFATLAGGEHLIKAAIFKRRGMLREELEEYYIGLEKNPEDGELKLFLKEALKRWR